jgi:hypothetical protein
MLNKATYLATLNKNGGVVCRKLNIPFYLSHNPNLPTTNRYNIINPSQHKSFFAIINKINANK